MIQSFKDYQLENTPVLDHLYESIKRDFYDLPVFKINKQGDLNLVTIETRDGTKITIECDDVTLATSKFSKIVAQVKCL
ncbi:TPA: hypothetical protein I7708_08655 [Vibrio vulnificus]|nr:hypothetical protein [Vibrio vulnificus]HAS8328728.1 hypothetical protein [Vibrio vulnificus]